MFARFVFVARLVCFFAGALVAASALYHGSPLGVLKALVLFSAAIYGHLWLKRTGKLAECERAADAMFSGQTLADDGDEARLDALLHRREELESRRGTPGFDPWEVQVVRREISDYVKTHPESTGHLDGRRW